MGGDAEDKTLGGDAGLGSCVSQAKSCNTLFLHFLSCRNDGISAAAQVE